VDGASRAACKLQFFKYLLKYSRRGDILGQDSD
jgi:hypothetical protein